MVDTVADAKLRELQTLAHFSPTPIFLITNILVSKVTVFVVFFFTPFCERRQSIFLMAVVGGKITINLKELHYNRKRRNTCMPEKSYKCTN